METEETPTWENLERLLESGNVDKLVDYIEQLGRPQLIQSLFRLNQANQQRLLQMLPITSGVSLIEDVPESHAADLIEGLPAAHAASLVSALNTEDQIDVLSEIEPEEREAILSGMQPDEAASAIDLLQYPEDSAGRLVSREAFIFSPTARVEDLLNALTDAPESMSRYLLQQAYIVDSSNRLLGSVRTKSIIGLPANRRLVSCLSPAVVVNASADLDTLKSCFSMVQDLALPVTTDDGRLVGVITSTKVDEAVSDQVAEDHLKSQGILQEELRSMPVRLRSKRRLSWLSINILLNILAASVIAAFQETLAAVIALAIFLPMVSDMSGCSGNQAVAVSMRELSLGIAKPRDTLFVWLKELQVGVINGIALGALLALVAFVWKGQAMLGVVVGLGLALNTVVAVSIGGTIPLFLRRFGIDPAVASGPMLTTVTDMCGFFLVLGIATLALPWL